MALQIDCLLFFASLINPKLVHLNERTQNTDFKNKKGNETQCRTIYFSDTTAQKRLAVLFYLVLFWTLCYSRQVDSDIGLLGARWQAAERLGVNHSFVSLSWHIQSVRPGEASTGTDSQGWEMGGQCVGFSIMTHRCSITLQIKSKMLNFNQAPLMAWCEEWLLCLRWQDGERERERGLKGRGRGRAKS